MAYFLLLKVFNMINSSLFLQSWCLSNPKATIPDFLTYAGQFGAAKGEQLVNILTEIRFSFSLLLDKELKTRKYFFSCNIFIEKKINIYYKKKIPVMNTVSVSMIGFSIYLSRVMLFSAHKRLNLPKFKIFIFLNFIKFQYFKNFTISTMSL